MDNSTLSQFFASREWYDNSRIKMIRSCKRKAYFQLIGPAGTPLTGGVGDGANFGSAVHAGLARYYNGWGHFDETTRRVHASRAFSDEWANYFPHEKMQSKHKLSRGLDILDAYFDHYLAEDALFEPIEAELGFCIEIANDIPIPKESQHYIEPFWYIGRIDGIFKQLSSGDLFLRETKTTSGLADPRLRQLKFDHQPLGYVDCVRRLSGDSRHNVIGYIGDVIQVAATKFDFARDYFHATQRQCESWRRQLIYTVEEWRELRSKALGLGQFDPDKHGWVNLDRFHQDTERCFEYGKCAFYELCDYGISEDTLFNFEPATWNPLLQRTPANIEIKENA